MGILRDYEPSCGPSFEALVKIPFSTSTSQTERGLTHTLGSFLQSSSQMSFVPPYTDWKVYFSRYQ